MTTAKLVTSLAGMALLLGSAAPALADERADDESVEVEASSSVRVDDDHLDDNNSVRIDLKSRIDGIRNFASSTLRQEKREEIKARVEDRKASTTERRIEKAQEKAGDAIDHRIESLTELIARLENIKLLPADQLAAITAKLNAEIANLTELKASVESDTATTTLKADVRAITTDHRIFLVVEPKARIAAAASRIEAVVSQLSQLADKLQDRITAAEAAGTDVAKATSAMTDLRAKLNDAKVQAQAAVSLTADLSADGGDAATIEANKQALKDARTKLATAEKDLAAARHDAATIYGVVKGKGSVNATTTAEVEAH